MACCFPAPRGLAEKSSQGGSWDSSPGAQSETHLPLGLLPLETLAQGPLLSVGPQDFSLHDLKDL